MNGPSEWTYACINLYQGNVKWESAQATILQSCMEVKLLGIFIKTYHLLLYRFLHAHLFQTLLLSPFDSFYEYSQMYLLFGCQAHQVILTSMYCLSHVDLITHTDNMHCKMWQTIICTDYAKSRGIITCRIYWWGDMWCQCREDFHGCLSVCARIISEVLLKSRVNRVIRTTTIQRPTLGSSCMTIHSPVCCVYISIVLSMRTPPQGCAFKTPAKQSKYAQQQYKDPLKV